MATGDGFFDAEGVWQFGELDVEVLMSDLLNKGQISVSAALALDRARLDGLEDDAAITTSTITPGGAAITAASGVKKSGRTHTLSVTTAGTQPAWSAAAVIGTIADPTMWPTVRQFGPGVDNNGSVLACIIEIDGRIRRYGPNSSTVQALGATWVR